MQDKNNKPVSLTLAHINDTHSYFEPTSLPLHIKNGERELTPFVSAGGFARIATRVHQLRDDATRMKRGFLFLHAGDCFQGTLYFSLFKGVANADMLNALNIDAMALGNHELDMGNEPVACFAQRIEFPLLAGNWDLSNECQEKAVKLSENTKVHSYNVEGQKANWIIKQIDGEPVAVFGLSLDKMDDIANPDADTPFVNALETAKNTVMALHSQGINKIILLSHLGYEADLELAESVSGISLIVGGHSHVLQGDFSDIGMAKSDPYGVKVNQTYVVQAGYHALSVGHCEIDFAANGEVIRFNGRNELLLGRRLFIDASMNEAATDQPHQQACDYLNQHPNVVVCKKDPQVQSILVDKYIPEVRKLQKQVIANASQPLRHVRIPDEQGPSQVAPLVAESFCYQMNILGHNVDFAIHNAGGVRTSLNAGKITVADIAGKLLPFAVPIGVYKVKGQVIAAALEGAINNATNNGVEGTGSGSYPYTHNLRFRYLKASPKGQRITNLEIYSSELGWQKVIADKVYTGASSAYTMKGKEGYEALLQLSGESYISNESMADCFIALLCSDPEKLTLETGTALLGK